MTSQATRFDTMPINTTPSLRATIQGAALVFGLLAAALSLLAALLLALAAMISAAPPVVSITVLISLAAVGLGLGVPLAVAAWRSQQQRASAALRMAPVWWLGLIFLGLLALGQLVSGTQLAVVLLPPLHVVASLLPPLIIVAAIVTPLQRTGAGLTRRNLITQLAYGGLFATAVAIALEVAVFVGVLILASAGVALLPDGADNGLRLAVDMETAIEAGDPMRLLRLLRSPGLVLGLGLLVAVVVPLLEETVKSLGAGFNGVVLGRLSRAQAFTFGVMAGVGFSFTEGLFYAAQLAEQGWAGAVILRGLTAVIHGAATGLFALGWYEIAAGRRARFVAYAAGSVGLHALWNGLSGLAALAGLGAMGGDLTAEMAGNAVAVAAATALAITWMVAVAVLVYLTRRLGAELRHTKEGVDDVTG